jgi:hypothetical protein
MSQDAIERSMATTSSQARSEAENAINSSANAIQINSIEGALSGIPVVGALAVQVGNALYAALSSPPLPVDPQRRTSQNDPIKLFAFAILIALVKFVWCFIKLLLNPLPIVGIFFPLCGSAGDSATEALSDMDRQAQDAAASRATAQAEGLQRLGAGTQLSTQQPNESGGVQQGISFDEFVRRTAGVSGVGQPERVVGNLGSSVLVPQPVQPTTANAPTTPAQRVTPGVDDGTNNQQQQDLKKAFGL